MRSNKVFSPAKVLSRAIAQGLVATAIFPVLSANAALTAVNAVGGGNGGERCLSGITCSGGSYNGALSIIAAIELDLGLASGTITRVDDELDQLWQATVNQGGQVLARARYADDKNVLGYDAGTGYNMVAQSAGNGVVLVTHPAEFGFDVHDEDYRRINGNNWQTLPLGVNSEFAFILRDRTTQDYWTSNNSGAGIGALGYDNSGGADQMVTFRINDGHYLLAFEDRALSGSDFDYNDFVAEVRFLQPLAEVPLPAAGLLMASGLTLLGFFRRKSH